MSLIAHVVVRSRGVDVSVAVGAHESLVLVGPNGSGKSTVVETIAGVVALDAGGVSIGGTAVTARTRDRARLSAPRIALVPQDGALLPHLNALDNVAFGPRARGARRTHARATAAAILDRIDASHLATRRPHELSGGEARRIAIGRALALDPEVIVLDEPFAGLDVDVAAGIRALAASLRHRASIVLTTHDAADAVLFGDTVAVLDAGRVVETGSPTDVFTRPRTAFAARMAGRTLVTGTVDNGELVIADGTRLRVAGDVSVGASAAVALRPADVRALPTPSPGDDTRVWLIRPLTGMEPRADLMRVYSGEIAADVDPSEARDLTTGLPVAFGLPQGLTAYEV